MEESISHELPTRSEYLVWTETVFLSLINVAAFFRNHGRWIVGANFFRFHGFTFFTFLTTSLHRGSWKGGEGVTNPISQPFYFSHFTSQCSNPIPTSRIQKKSRCYTYDLFSLLIHKITASKYDPTLSFIIQENSFQFYGKHYLQPMVQPWVQK